MRRRLRPWSIPLLLCVVLPAGARAAWAESVVGDIPAGAAAAVDPASETAVILPDSLVSSAPDFESLRPELLSLTAARVAATAWALVPRLVELDRPDLLVEFLVYWEDRCGESEPIVRTRLLAAIWDDAFDEGLYDASIAGYLDTWELRDPGMLSTGRNDFDAFTTAFADQLLPHQDDGSLPEFFCLEYSGRLPEAATLLAEDGLADTWLRWYRDNPEGADGGVVVDGAAAADAGAAGPSVVLLTVGLWRPRGDIALAGDHVLVGGLVEQRLATWFLRLPVEVRLGRTDRPYMVDQSGVRARSDRFDALYLGVEIGRPVLRSRAFQVEAFGGLGYDGIRPFLKQDVMLATLNVNLGIGLRRQEPGRPLVLGLDFRREWLGTRNEGVDSLSGNAWSLRLGAGLRFGRNALPAGGSR